MMHKDLSKWARRLVEADVRDLVASLEGQSLAIAREAWLAAFDKTAEELDSDGTK